MHTYDVTRIPVPPGAPAGAAPALLICTDDGGVFRAEPADADVLQWTYPTWNIPRSRTRPLPDGLGPPSFRQTQRSAEQRTCWRRTTGARIEVLVGVGHLDPAENRGRVVLSRDRGLTFSDRYLAGLPEGIISALVSTSEPFAAGAQLAEHAVMASVIGHGLYLLEPSSYVWRALGEMYAQSPSGDLIAYGSTDPNAPPQHVSLPKRLAFSCLYELLRDDIPDTAPLFASDPTFDGAVQQSLDHALSHEPLPDALVEQPFAGSPVTVARKRDIVRHVHDMVGMVLPGLRNSMRACFVLHRPIGAIHAYCSLNLPTIFPFARGTATGTFGVIDPPRPPGFDTLAGPMVDDTLLEAFGPPGATQLETPAERAQRIAIRIWRAVGAVASDYAGLYRLEASPGHDPVDVQNPPETGLYWRQIAGLARVHGWTAGDPMAQEEDDLSSGEVVQFGFPQAWRSITSLAPSPTGALAVTTDTVRLSARAFLQSPGLDDTHTNAPLRDQLFEGGVFLLGDPSALVPTKADDPSEPVFDIRLLFTHPAAACAAFSDAGLGSQSDQLFVALAVYTIMERVYDGALAQALIPVVGPFTTVFPEIKEFAGSLVSYRWGVALANEKYFESEGTLNPRMRWPTGLFRVQASAYSPATNYTFFPVTEFGNELAMRALKADFAADHRPPTTIPAPCLEAVPPAGSIQQASAMLLNVTYNQCCSPHQYHFIKALGEWLYCGRVGASMMRARLEVLASSPTITPGWLSVDPESLPPNLFAITQALLGGSNP